MKTNQARSRLGALPAALTTPGTRNTLFCAGLGAALLALTTSCSGGMGEGSDAIDTERVGQGSELDLSTVVEKAQFPVNPTFDGFLVTCSASDQRTINAAEVRAREILDASIEGTEDVEFEFRFFPDILSLKARRFQLFFADGITDPLTVALIAARMREKLENVSAVMATAFHTCHDEDESVTFRGGELETCAESNVDAATDFAGGALTRIRWCHLGLGRDPNIVAITLLHELSHQDRTADSTGTRVFDDNRNGLPYNAGNISRWLGLHT